MSFKTFLKSYKKKEEQNMRREKRETVVKKKLLCSLAIKGSQETEFSRVLVFFCIESVFTQV